MRKVLLGVALFGLVASGANAALLFLDAGGSGSLDLAPGQSGDMSLMITIREIDVGWGPGMSSGFAFVNAFLNDDDDTANGEVDVTGLTEGIGSIYDRGAFVLPADISWDGNNDEYGLIMGNGPDGPGSAWGPGTYVLDTLALTHNGASTSGTVPVTFEKGGRAPHIFADNLTLYAWGLGLDDVIGGFADPGVGDGADDTYNPFNINFVPEPASLALVAFGGLALLRRRR